MFDIRFPQLPFKRPKQITPRPVHRFVVHPLQRPTLKLKPIARKRKTKKIQEETMSSIHKPLPLGSVTFTNSSTSNSETFVVEPQRDFRIQRLQAIIKRTSGADAIEVWLKDVKIENESQLISTEFPLSLDGLSQDAVGVRWNMRDVKAGKKIQADIELSSLPAAGETVIVTLTAWGVEL